VRKSSHILLVNEDDPPLEKISKYSNLQRALRVTAMVIRAVKIFKGLRQRNTENYQRIGGPLTIDEINTAETTLIRLAQKSLPKNYQTKPEIMSLSPFKKI
jgi:hypothetical protein